MSTINRYLTLALFFTVIFGLTITSFSQSNEESAANDLPLPSVLLKNHIAAVGGEHAIRNHSTQTTYGKLIIKVMGLEGKMIVIAEAPDKIKTTIELGQYGESSSGYNGKVGWSMDPMSGKRVLDGEGLKQMTARADFYGNDLNLGKNSIKMETVETVSFENVEQYKVLLVNQEGEESYLYFSKETGLLNRIDKMELGAMGKAPAQIRLSNYTESDGVKTARRIVSSQNGMETIIEIDSVSYGPIPENAFEIPAEIQSLLNK